LTFNRKQRENQLMANSIPIAGVPASTCSDSSSDILLARYQEVRAMTEQLADPLGPEDCQVQSMPDASPVKWHLAHTTWFFETFLLVPHLTAYKAFHPSFSYLFNSYYNAVGNRQPRAQRGLLTRPSLDEVYAYRRAVDAALERLLLAESHNGSSSIDGV